jgi:hypothetical protein
MTCNRTATAGPHPYAAIEKDRLAELVYKEKRLAAAESQIDELIDELERRNSIIDTLTELLEG